MKRLFLFTVIALAAIACNKSVVDVENPNSSVEGTHMSITVEMPSSADTNLDFDQTGDTWITKWLNGDKLTALHYSGTTISNDNTEFTLSEVSEDGKSATFDGSYDNTQDGMVLIYSGVSAGNILSGQASLTLANQNIKMATADDQNVVTQNATGALSEYSYMISEQVDLKNVPADYNSVSISHLTSLIELKLQLTNLPEDKTFSVSEIQVGISQEDYDEIKTAFDDGEFGGILTEMPIFATLHTEESYDITKGFGEDGFATASTEMGVYTLAVEGLEVSSTNNTFTIPFNAFPFTVNQGECFDITVVLTQDNEENNTSFFTPLNFQIINNTDSALEFPRGKHHTISYSYDCEADDSECVWDGENFESVTDAEDVLGEAVEGVYEISTAAQLAAMSYLVNNANSTYGSADYTLVAPLDLNNKEWTPIGNSDTNPFSGTFDGNNHAISGLYINNSSFMQGLFGVVSNETGKATIENVSVSGSITAGTNSAGIVGLAIYNTTINNCHNRASVTGADNTIQIGGIIGSSYSDNDKKNYIINCSNSGTIEALLSVGGIAGYVGAGSIANSYNLGDIIGETDVIGGIAGALGSANVTNCYNSGAVECPTITGGVIGLLDGGTVVDCYWLSEVGGASNGIGFDQSTGAASNEGTTPMTDAEMQHLDFATLLRNGAYFYNLTVTDQDLKAYSWATYPPLPYPVLSSYEELAYNLQGQGLDIAPYLISSANDLRQLSALVNAGESYSGKYFEITNDIDLKSEEFTPIGFGGENQDIVFCGSFDGGNHTVSNLKITSSEYGQAALFGVVTSATIANLTVTGSIDVNSESCYVGGIVAIAANIDIINCSSAVVIENRGANSISAAVCAMANNSVIANCYNTAKITNSGDAYSTVGEDGVNIVGENSASGIVGAIFGSKIVNCYNSGDISATGTTQDNGSMVVATGITAVAMFSSEINNCYSSGAVSVGSGNGHVGGVIGMLEMNSTATNCYWDSQKYTGDGIGSVGNATQANIQGFSTIDMQAESFITLLNNGAYTYNQNTPDIKACAWVKGSGYPIFDFSNTNPPYSQLGDVEEGTGF